MDCVIIEETDQTVDLSGIDDHTVRNLRLVTAGSYAMTSEGPVILVFNQAAYMGDGRTIISSAQLEHFGCVVNDRSRRVTKKDPYVQLPEGHRIPIAMRKGLPYVKLRKYTPEEFKSLPHIHVTSPHPWDPSILDSEVSSDWYDTQPKPKGGLLDQSPFDVMGRLKRLPEDDEESEDDTDRKHQAVDRLGIRAYLSRIIQDELVDDVAEMDIWEDGHVAGNEDSDEGMRAFPVTTRSGKRLSRRKDPKPGQKPVRRRKNRQTDLKTAPKPPITTPIAANAEDSSDAEDDELPPPLVGRDNSDSSSDDDSDIDDGYNNRAKDGQAKFDRDHPMEATPRVVKPARRNLDKYGKYFPGITIDVLRKTLDATTQYATKGATEGPTLHNRIKSPNPVLTVPRRHEDVATDTLYSNHPSVQEGATAAQFFIGRKSHFRSVYPLGKTDKNFVHTLMDEIRKYGAMDTLVSDNAKAQISMRVKEIQRMFAIDDWQSEPYKGNQNFAERGWKDTKTKTKNLLNYTGAPGSIWLLAVQYICFVQNHTAVKSLGWRTPTEWLLGYTPDISVLLQFQFWEPVYYAKHDDKFPGDSNELLGRFVGVESSPGHAMAFKILTEEGNVIRRMSVRSAVKGGMFENKRADELSPALAPNKDIALNSVDNDKILAAAASEEEMPAEGVDKPRFDHDTFDSDAFKGRMKEDILYSEFEKKMEEGAPMPTIHVDPLLGRTFIDDPDEEGEQRRAKVESFEPTGKLLPDKSDQLYKFRCRVGEKVFEETMTYNKMLEWCDRDIDKDDHYKINGIVDHKDGRVGGRVVREVLVDWEDGTKTWEPFDDIFNDDPISLARYARVNDLLDQPGWKRLRPYAKNKKKFARMVNQARLKSIRSKPRYKFGYQIPRSHDEAVRIDERMGNTKWQDSTQLELDQLFEYETFIDKGLGAPVPEGYQKIPCHIVYDVKHDGRHKSRFVGGGHRTSVPNDSTYSSVVSLQSVRICTLLAELNDLDIWSTDIGNAYLESYTREKVCFIAGPEFKEKEGHLFIISKALYGLRTSGQSWHDRLYDVLIDMGFVPSRADPDIWMRARGDHYEYIAVYVDDLLICSRNPKAITDELSGPREFKLKGTGPVTYHLGCDYYRDDDGTLCVAPRKYIERMSAQYLDMFGERPRANMSSPLEHGDHPELDTSPLLDDDGIAKYQSLIGALQWAISLGRFDVATAVMSMSGFRAAPREGHLERVKRIVGYLAKMKQGAIRVRTEEPEYADIPATTYDWSHTVYGDVREMMPTDAPKPLGKRVVLTTYVDANLQHDLTTGKSVTGVLHFVNQTPVEWFSKKQPTVETATYGSEFIAAKTATQQTMGLRMTLRYLGVHVHGPTHLFGDNGSVVTSGTFPTSPLKKRHLSLAYHYTREAVASGAIDFQHIPGQVNPADILSKHWGYQAIWPMLQAVLFWQGDTSLLLVDKADRPNEGKGSDKRSIQTGDSKGASDQ